MTEADISDELNLLAEKIKKTKRPKKKDLAAWIDRLEELAWICEEGLDE